MEEGMTYSRGMWVTLALGTLLVVGAGCAGSATKSNNENRRGADSAVLQDEADESSGTTSSAVPAVLGDTSVDEMVVVAGADESIREITLTAQQWSFDPSVVRVKLGETVRFTITNKDVNHGFAIPTLGVNQFIGAGETVSVEFTADKAGEHTFFCNNFCGSGHGGMRGTLIVE